MFLRLLIILCLLPAALAAKDDSARIANKIEAKWSAWMEKHGITHSTIAIFKDGDPALVTSIGRPEFEAVPLASLGKAVTGACIGQLVKRGVTTYNTPLKNILGESFAFGDDFTLAELLTHSTGLGPDSTQNAMPGWKRVGEPQHDAATRMALSRVVQTGKRGAYGYNNENYAILGRVIEKLTNKSYGDVCRELVLTPAGVTSAKLPKRYGAFGAFGGWWMSVEDYGRFIQHNFRDSNMDPFQTPNIGMGGGMHYGLGVVFREWGGGTNFWHFGAICFRKGSAQSYFANWQSGWMVVVGLDACLDFGTLATLDQAMVSSAHN